MCSKWMTSATFEYINQFLNESEKNYRTLFFTTQTAPLQHRGQTTLVDNSWQHTKSKHQSFGTSYVPLKPAMYLVHHQRVPVWSLPSTAAAELPKWVPQKSSNSSPKTMSALAGPKPMTQPTNANYSSTTGPSRFSTSDASMMGSLSTAMPACTATRDLSSLSPRWTPTDLFHLWKTFPWEISLWGSSKTLAVKSV